MNPMSLLTLPPGVLQSAMTHEATRSPHGERCERALARAAVTAVLVLAAWVAVA